MKFLADFRNRIAGIGRLNLYLLRQLLVAFAFACVAVTFVILFTQSFRLLSLVIDNSSTMWFFFRLMALSVPTFLPLVFPLGLGVAVVFVYHKLAVDSELVVMRAAGVSPMRQAAPAFLLAGTIVALGYFLTLWIAPAANRDLVALEYRMRDNFAMLLSRPGNFNDITDGLTFYARARGPGGALEGILMHDVRKPETPITIMADRGQVTADQNGQPQLVIFDGRRQEMNVATGQLSQLAFDQYVLDINGMISSPSARLPEPREQPVWHLLDPGPEIAAQPDWHERMLAELNQRLATPLLALSYTMIGLAAMLSGEFNRRGMSRRILAAALGIIAVQVASMSIVSMIVRETWLAFALYLAVLAPVAVGAILLNAGRLRNFVRPRAPAALPS